jgi:hypothetical protein
MTALDLAHTPWTRVRSPRLTLVQGGADGRRRPACTREIRVLIAAQHPLVRRALGAPLDDSPDIAIAAEAATDTPRG